MRQDVNLILIAAEGHDDAQSDIIDAIYVANGQKPPSLRKAEEEDRKKKLSGAAVLAFARRHNAKFKARKRGSKPQPSVPSQGIPSGGRPPRPTQRRKTEP